MAQAPRWGTLDGCEDLTESCGVFDAFPLWERTSYSCNTVPARCPTYRSPIQHEAL